MTLKFKKQRNTFENSSRSLEVNLEKGYVRSYDTIVGKRLGNQWFLTTHKYSVTTTQHIGTARWFVEEKTKQDVFVNTNCIDDIKIIRGELKAQITECDAKIASNRVKNKLCWNEIKNETLGLLKKLNKANLENILSSI
jgi:hypothetical protein